MRTAFARGGEAFARSFGGSMRGELVVAANDMNEDGGEDEDEGEGEAIAIAMTTGVDLTWTRAWAWAWTQLTYRSNS